MEHIKLALCAPDFKIESPQGKIIVTKEIDKKVLKVVYFKKENKNKEYVIITAYYIT